MLRGENLIHKSGKRTGGKLVFGRILTQRYFLGKYAFRLGMNLAFVTREIPLFPGWWRW